MNAYNTIAHLNPCVDASGWLKTQPDAQTAWDTCHRGDWMLWLLLKTELDQRTSVTLACRFARLALTHVTPGDNRPLAAIEAAEAWIANPCDGTRVAADAAYATRAAYSTYAARAAYAAARAAARAAAYAAADADAAYSAAAYSAYSAYADAAADARAAARADVRVEQANIIREIVPVCPFGISKSPVDTTRE